MDYEVIEKRTTRKWDQMTAEERRQELELLRKSGDSKLFSIIMLQKKLKKIIYYLGLARDMYLLRVPSGQMSI